MPPPDPSSRPPSPDEGNPSAVLVRRLERELAADFDPRRAIRLGAAPGRLDVMGGIAEETGSLICQMTLSRQAVVAMQERSDRQLQVFSFNLHDDNKPFTLRIPLDSLADRSVEELRRGFHEPGRLWAAHLAGCLFILHEQGLVDLKRPQIKGLNLAVYSDVPMSAGVSSSGALQVATMMNLVDHFDLRSRVDGLAVAGLCAQVEHRVVGGPGGLSRRIAGCVGRKDRLLRMDGRSSTLLPDVELPENVQILGINSNVSRSDGGERRRLFRRAAFMAHKIILRQMEAMGQAAGRAMQGDPMQGYLANLDQEDYKRFFRPILPEYLTGRRFLDEYGSIVDSEITIDPDVSYPIQGAADHHIMEPRRVTDFVQHLTEAAGQPAGTRDQGICLDKAGHLMYASHRSYQHHALLSTPEADLLVQLVRKHEPAGLYGARITDAGGGGTVAVLADQSPRAQGAIEAILKEFEQQTGRHAELLSGSSEGAWHAGTRLVGQTE